MQYATMCLFSSRSYQPVLIILFFFFSVVDATAQEVRVGIGFALPPYVIQENDVGMEVEIIREALGVSGHKATFVYLPNLRLPVAYDSHEVDCVVANVSYELGSESRRQTYPSKPTIAYQNFAITLEESQLEIKSIDDLRALKVLAFNNATKYLGKEFALMAESNPKYTELADQSLQVMMLTSGRVQAVVSDKRIFLWWRHRLKSRSVSNNILLSQSLTFHPVFPPAWRQVTFANKGLRDDFNRGLEVVQGNGVFDAIVRKYIGSEMNP